MGKRASKWVKVVVELAVVSFDWVAEDSEVFDRLFPVDAIHDLQAGHLSAVLGPVLVA